MVDEENDEHNEGSLILESSPDSLMRLDQLGMGLIFSLQRITKVHRSGNTIFFKSRLHERLFYLKVNDPQYDPFLGITRMHKIDRQAAIRLEKRYFAVFREAQNSGFNDIINFKNLYECIESVFFRVYGGLSE